MSTPHYKYKMQYTYPSFPQVPDSLIKNLIDYFEECRPLLVSVEGFDHFKVMPKSKQALEEHHPVTSDIDNNIGYPPSVAIATLPNLCLFTIIPIPQFAKDWVEKNIPIENLHCTLLEFRKGTHFFPHIDLVRTTVWNYIIDAGGDDVRTCYYEPTSEFSQYKVQASTYIPYDRIKLIESIGFPERTWHQYNVDEIHSVENINLNRRRLILSLSTFTSKENRYY